MKNLLRFLKDNSLSIMMFALFAICFIGHSVASWRLQDEQLVQNGHAAIGYLQNMVSSNYLQELSSNWQAAFLQLTSLIVFSIVLYQRGAPHSRYPDKRKKQKKRREKNAEDARFPWLYRNSLSVTFVGLFTLSFVMHLLSGASDYNHHLRLLHRPAITFAAFLTSARFWTSTLETWQAEYLTIALYIVFSVFLRQRDSAESKPLESGDEDTGESNDWEGSRTRRLFPLPRLLS